MVKLLKYEVKQHWIPFAALLLLNILWGILCVFGIEETIVNLCRGVISFGNFLIIIYSIKVFFDDFYEETNTLGFLLPVRQWKRFIVKYLYFCVAYGIIVILYTWFALYDKKHIYSIMYNELINPEQYILYALSDKIISFISGMMLVGFSIYLAKKIRLRYKLVSGRGAIDTVIALIIIVLSIVIFVKFFDNNPSALLLKLQLKSGLYEYNYKYTQYITFIPMGVGGSYSGSSDISTMYIPSINLVHMILNAILTFVLLPFTLKLSENK